MSRIGKQPINLPNGVTTTVTDGVVVVKGPKGELSQKLHSMAVVEVADNAINVMVKNPNDKKQRAIWGLMRSLLQNMVIGVTEGFSKKLEFNGVGYKVAVSGSNVNMSLGYSHPIVFPLPQGITAEAEKNVLTLTGFDKHLVGETAAQIRKLRKPEPYKGKGVKYDSEVIRRKAGKAAKAAG